MIILSVYCSDNDSIIVLCCCHFSCCCVKNVSLVVDIIVDSLSLLVLVVLVE